MLLPPTLEISFNFNAHIMPPADNKITRQDVLELIQRIPMPLTTKEMARVLQVKEVSVRAAIIWLEIGGYIKESGTFTRKYENKSYTKKVTLWRWSGKADPICKVAIKETDQVDRERNVMFSGDSLMLQNILMRMGK